MGVPDDIQIVYCTVPDSETGRRIAGYLVEYRLAACVNLLPGIESIYKWKGEIHRDSEVLLMIKSRGADYTALESGIRKLHPYELPEIIAVPVGNGSPEYLEWIRTAHNEAQ